MKRIFKKAAAVLAVVLIFGLGARATWAAEVIDGQIVIEVGESYTIQRIYGPAANGADPIAWGSSDPTIATVSNGGTIVSQGSFVSSGIVTGISPGTVSIVAAVTTHGTTTTTVRVVAKTPGEIAVNGISLKNSHTFSIGETHTLIATIIPADATNRSILWESYNDSVVAVDGNGEITALSEGAAVITATSAANSNVSASCTVTVETQKHAYDDTMAAFAFSKLIYEDNLLGLSGLTVEKLSLGLPISALGKIWDGLDVTYADWYNDVAGDWTLHSVVSDKACGFFAAAFDAPDSNKRIIAFRGTDGFDDIAADFDFAVWNKLSPQFSQALCFYNANKQGKDIFLVGHSLGGALSNYVSMITMAESIAINGATGIVIDDAFVSNGSLLYNHFNGVDKWKFSNHITQTSVADASFNYQISYPNIDKYTTFTYPQGRSDLTSRGFFRGKHTIESMLNYDTENSKFSIGNATSSGTTTTPKYFSMNGLTVTNKKDVILGTSSADNLKQERMFVSAVAYGGDGNDSILTQGGQDTLVGGGGANVLDGGTSDDSYVITDSENITYINDSSGNDKIILLSGSISNITSDTSGLYYSINISDGRKIFVNKCRNSNSPKISVVNGSGEQLGTVGSQSRLSRTFSAQPTIKTIMIEGTATIGIYDDNGALLNKFDNSTDGTFYEQYGYFYMEQGRKISATLFNGNYNIVVNGNGAIDYSIIDYAADDTPLTTFEVTNVSLNADTQLETQSYLSADNLLPFVLKNTSTNVEQKLTPTVTDLTAQESLTVTASIGGTITTGASGSYASGTSISLAATPSSGYSFRNWTSSNGGTFANANSASTTFIMPANATTVTANFELASTATYSLNIVTQTGGSVTIGASGIYASGANIDLAATPSSGYDFKNWTSSNGGTFINANGESTIFTMPANDTTITANFSYTGESSNSGGDSGSNGGSNGLSSSNSSKQDTSTPNPYSWLEEDRVQELLTTANGDMVKTKSTGIYGIRKEIFAALRGKRFVHDTMENGVVLVRLYINEPTKIKRDALVSAYVSGHDVKVTQNKFAKWFTNNVQVIHMDEQQDWDAPVQIAARVNLKGMNSKNLNFYSYDKKTNSYLQIKAPAYWIDKKGYLHFATPYSRDIVVSDGALDKR